MTLNQEVWIGIAVLGLLLWSIYREVARRPSGEATLKDAYLLEVRCLNGRGCETLLYGDDKFPYMMKSTYGWPTKKVDWTDGTKWFHDEEGVVGWIEYEIYTEIGAALLRYRLAKRRQLSANAAAYDVHLFAGSRGPTNLSFDKQVGCLLQTAAVLRYEEPYVIPGMRRPAGTVWESNKSKEEVAAPETS